MSKASALQHRIIMTTYLRALIEGLSDAGVRDVVISPGSRSTPLTILAYNHPHIRTHVIVDERSAAFFALGIAKAARQPVALICTSGTAGANYYPAVCEAYESQIPLILLTADRPAELHGVGAAQTMNQHDLFGSHVKESVSVALPEAGDAMTRYAYFQGFRRTHEALQSPRGPVHLNVPVREPLLPVLDAPAPELIRGVRVSSDFGDSDLTQESCQESCQELPQTNEMHTSGICAEPVCQSVPPALLPYVHRKGLLLVSGQLSIPEAQLWLALAQHLRWPIIADPLANLAHCGADATPLMRHAELFISHLDELSDSACDVTPEVIIQRGPLPVSKAVNQQIHCWITQGVPLVFIDESETWKEQLQCAELVVSGDAYGWIRSALKDNSIRTDSSWLACWAHIEHSAAAALADMPEFTNTEDDALTHSGAVHAILSAMPDNAQLMIANSNAIRLMDRYENTAQAETRFTAYGNRGVNGIDGLISTAAGLAAARPDVPTVLILGDLAAFHDMNGLEIVARYKLPLTVVLLNNHGGGIFRFLSQASLPPSQYRPLFETAVDVNFERVAALYHADYARPSTLRECVQAVHNAAAQRKLSIIEVLADADAEVELLSRAHATIAEHIADWSKSIATHRASTRRHDA